MATSPDGPRVDGLRFAVERAVIDLSHDTIAVIDVAGRIYASTRRSAGRPRLTITVDGQTTELRAVQCSSSHLGPKPDLWEGVFAAPRNLVELTTADFGLAVGRSTVLPLQRPAVRAAQSASPMPKPEPQPEADSWGSLVVDVAETRRELVETRTRLDEARRELARVRSDLETAHTDAAQPDEVQPRTREAAPTSPSVTWLDEIEDVPSDDGDGEDAVDAPADRDLRPTIAPLPNRTSPPMTFEHDVVYEATLRRLQHDRRRRTAARRARGRALAFVVLLVLVAVLYLVFSGAIGIDAVDIF